MVSEKRPLIRCGDALLAGEGALACAAGFVPKGRAGGREGRTGQGRGEFVRWRGGSLGSKEREKGREGSKERERGREGSEERQREGEGGEGRGRARAKASARAKARDVRKRKKRKKEREKGERETGRGEEEELRACVRLYVRQEIPSHVFQLATCHTARILP